MPNRQDKKTDLAEIRPSSILSAEHYWAKPQIASGEETPDRKRGVTEENSEALIRGSSQRGTEASLQSVLLKRRSRIRMRSPLSTGGAVSRLRPC